MSRGKKTQSPTRLPKELDNLELDVISGNSNRNNSDIDLTKPISCDEARKLPADTTAIIYIPSQYASRLADRRELDKRWEWLVDDIINVGSLHLIAGPSGAGKTRWLFKFMFEWSHGLPILGKVSNPKPFVYLSCDRGLGELNQTLTGLGYRDWDIPAFAVEELNIKFGLNHSVITLEELPTIFPWAKVFFIEAIGWFMPSTNKSSTYNETLKYWGKIRERYEEKGLTLIGTTHSPKQTQDKKYTNPRDRVIGSVGWPAIASTIIVIDPDENVKSRRHLSILPRNAPDMYLVYQMNESGQMVMVADETDEEVKRQELAKKQAQADEDVKSAAHHKLEVILQAIIDKGINTFHKNLLTGEAEGTEKVAGYATIFRWINRKIDEGRLKRLQGGNYQIVRLQ